MKQKNRSSVHCLFARWLCVLLCALLAAGVLAGCRKQPDTPAPAGTTATPATDPDPGTDTEPEDNRDDLDDAYHFDRTFTILSRESTAGEFDSASAIGSDEVANAIFSRNAQVEARADVTIKVIPLKGDWEAAGKGDSRGGNKTFEERVRNNSLVGESQYDLIATHSAYLANLAVEGLGMDLTTLEDLHLTRRWWSEAYYNECNYNGAIYMMVGDLAYTLYDYMEVVFFNETMATRYYDEIGNLYNLALEGNWTYARMKEYAGVVNYNPDADENTREYGLLTNCHAQRAFANAIEANYLVKQEDGTRLYPDTMNETAEKRLSDFISFVREGNGVLSPRTWDDAKGTESPIFSSGRALFYMQTLGESLTLKATMSDSYGVLPFPKWDDTQIEYHVSTKDSVTSVMIPRNIADPKSTGVVTEMLAMYGNRVVTNAYYEKVLKLQAFNTPECIQMLEMIRLSANLSFQQVFSNCLDNPNSLVSEAIRESTPRAISAMYASDHARWNIAKLYEDLKAIPK